MPLLLALLLNTAAAAPGEPVGVISGSKAKTGWDKEWRTSVGLRGGLAVPMFSSAAAWSLAMDKGAVVELALPGKGLSWVFHADHSRHTLVDGERYLADLADGAGAALDGVAVHWWLQAGLRWEPELPATPGLKVAPVFGGLFGADVHRTDLELPTVDGRERVRSVGAQPSLAPTFGVNFKVHPNLHLLLGTSYGVFFAFDSAEVAGSDRVAVTGRLNTALEVLGRF